MNRVKTILLEKRLVIFQFCFLVGMATIAPVFRQQIITGPMVNATLFLATAILGPEPGILVGFIPSVLGLSTGLLPIALVGMVPFIIVGNALLVVIFDLLKKKNYWLAVVSASVGKFIFLWMMSSVIFSGKEALAAKAMMGGMQFLTAILGGMLCRFLIDFFKLRNF